MKTTILNGRKWLLLLLTFVIMLACSATLFVGCGSGGGEKAVTSVEIMMPPSKIQYVVGETFDPTGMAVTLVYDDGTRSKVTDYTVDTTTPLKETDTEVTITWGDYTMKQAITVIKPEDRIVVLLSAGVDRCELYADGTAIFTGGGGTGGVERGTDCWWTWDGKDLRIWVKNYTNQVKDEKASELELVKDMQGNYSCKYVVKGRWTIEYFVKHADWSAELKEGVPFEPVEGTIEIPYDNVYES